MDNTPSWAKRPLEEQRASAIPQKGTGVTAAYGAIPCKIATA